MKEIIKNKELILLALIAVMLVSSILIYQLNIYFGD